MDRNDFIITVYCLVCEHYQAIRAAQAIRRGGARLAFDSQRRHYRRQYHATPALLVFARQRFQLL